MLAQTVLPFKLESTEDPITAHAGLVLFGEYLHAVGLSGCFDRELPFAGLPAVGYGVSTRMIKVL